MEKFFAASRKAPAISWQVAALRVCFGHGEGDGAIKQRILALAKGTDGATTTLHAVQVGAFSPSTDNAVLEAVLGLGRKPVELNKRSGSCWPLA